ncbi:MAG: cytochrome c [Halieaceae bacterium]|jgi:cytochrome c553|nr:cytochrome c [Halieaceae bacterium]
MKLFLTLVVGMLCVSLSTVRAGGLEAGREKSVTCAACHGAVGISPNTAWPNLAGQQKAYLVKQMKDFRDGKRIDPWMSPMAKPLSDEDIEDLAAFYNSLPVRDEYQ